MKLDIRHINEYHSLYGGIKKRKEIGNAFQALVSHHFDDTLIFSIVETVNLNNPSLFGIGDTIFFTHRESDEENQWIKEEYKRIIGTVEKKFNHAIAAYSNWYEADTVLITNSEKGTGIFDTNDSQWRTRIFANREEKDAKAKFGFLEYNNEKHPFRNHIEDYFKFYITLLESNLYFKEFPFYAVIAKSISIKDKNRRINLGNVYLHFATTELKDDDFYHRLLNDFLFIWIQEEGMVLLNEISSDAAKKMKIEIAKTHLMHLPAIWAMKDSTKFSPSEIKKIDEPFGSSNKILKDFYDEVFILNDVIDKSVLDLNEQKIVAELIPQILQYKGWLKEGVKIKNQNSVITQIKFDVEHKKFTGFVLVDLQRFVSLLSLRHVVNICLCCFGLQIDEIHSLLTSGKIEKEIVAKGQSSRYTSYFSKLFFFSPKGARKNILSFDQHDALTSASLKEIDFLKSCVTKINLLIKDERRTEYNKSAVAKFQLNSIEVKRFDTENVSRLAVFDFKKNWCDENTIISKLLKEKLSKYLMPPILDCGTGLGDIAFSAFPDKEAILIDVNPIVDKETPLSPLHSHLIKSFFDYFPDKDINTLLISHTLQFIDSDIEILNRQIQNINPRYIILILNENDDIMGDVLKWTKENYENSNPEESIEGFPVGYELIHDEKFQASVNCVTFAQLAKQISYLMMIDLSETGELLEKFLETKLTKPEFKLNQAIKVYMRT